MVKYYDFFTYLIFVNKGVFVLWQILMVVPLPEHRSIRQRSTCPYDSEAGLGIRDRRNMFIYSHVVPTSVNWRKDYVHINIGLFKEEVGCHKEVSLTYFFGLTPYIPAVRSDKPSIIWKNGTHKGREICSHFHMVSLHQLPDVETMFISFVYTLKWKCPSIRIWEIMLIYENPKFPELWSFASIWNYPIDVNIWIPTKLYFIGTDIQK